MTIGNLALWRMLNRWISQDELTIGLYHQTEHIQPKFVEQTTRDWLNLGFVQGDHTRNRGTNDPYYWLEKLFTAELNSTQLVRLIDRIYEQLLRPLGKYIPFKYLLPVD